MTSSKMSTAVCVVIAFAMVEMTHAHSYMTYPQGTGSGSCRMGGEPQFSTPGTCKGPCDFSRIEGERKDCWGANPVEAKGDDLAPKDKYSFDMIGSDGLEHDHPKGYYTVEVTIPDVIPDGKYYLGWVWYGGTGGKIQGNVQQAPGEYSYFGEYWTCSWIRVEGGAPLASSYTPKFVNDMTAYSTEGCMSSTNRLGDCVVEPCRGKDTAFQKPIEFASGDPRPITPADFGGSAPPGDPAPSKDPAPSTDPAPTVDPVPSVDPPSKETPTPMPDYPDQPKETPASDYPPPRKESPAPDAPVDKVYFDKDLMSCLCIAGSSGCFSALAAYTNDCKSGTKATYQKGECVSSCCALCKETGDRFAACRHYRTQYVCKL